MMAPLISPYCTQSCREMGACYLDGAECIAASDALCAQSFVGRIHGRTSAVEGLCEATTLAGCAASRRCLEDGECFPEDGRCVKRIRSTGMRVGGILSMSLGGATLAAGLLWAAAGSAFGFSEDVAIIAGTLLGNGAVGMFAVGLPLLVVGSHEYRPGDPEAEQVRLQLTPTGASLSVSF